MSKIVDMAKKFGVVNSMEPVLAMALGAGETTPYKLTAAYAAFVNGGRKITPHLIELVEDREGKPVYKADKRDCPLCNAAYDGQDPPEIQPAGTQIIDPITAYQMDSMLEGVVAHGTAYQAHILGPNVGGKTGTTNNYRSAWFVGTSSDVVVGVFVGFDDNRSLGEGETGAVAAVPIFIEFMQSALKTHPARPIKAPADARFIMVNGVPEAFRRGTEPKAIVASTVAKPSGPQPYASVWGNGQLTGAPNAAAAVQPQQPQPPPKKKPPADLSGLY
jgi:penicillin-binding protein 1A